MHLERFIASNTFLIFTDITSLLWIKSGQLTQNKIKHLPIKIGSFPHGRMVALNDLTFSYLAFYGLKLRRGWTINK